jgi:hypothetical protein|tara:strand:- start:1623 stop:1892 length:270 start_codon:yes stop_codon:yes gene_type:complete
LSNWAPHGVPDSDDVFDSKIVEKRNSIVSAICQSKRLLGTNSPTMTAMVKGDKSVSAFEGRVAAVPIQIRCGGPTMKQQNGWSAWRCRQ